MKKEVLAILLAMLSGSAIISLFPTSILAWEIGILIIISSVVSLAFIYVWYVPPIMMIVSILIAESVRRVTGYSEFALSYMILVVLTIIITAFCDIIENEY